MRIVAKDAVPGLLDVDATLRANALALRALHLQEAQVPLRTVLDVRDGTSLFMPACYAPAGGGGSSGDVLGVKIVSVMPRNAERGLPPVTGTLIVMDPTTGAIRGLVDAEESTAWRTAAGSALSALAFFRGRESEARKLVVFGAGPQSHAHVKFLLHVLPSIASVAVVGRSAEKLAEFVTHLAPEHPGASFAHLLASDPSLTPTISDADIIAACTSSSAPLFDGSLPKPGCHVIAVGAYRPTTRELDVALMQRAWCVACDSAAACGKEAGELQGLGEPGRAVDLGSLYGVEDGRAVPDAAKLEGLRAKYGGAGRDLSVYKSVGVAVQDVFMGEMLLSRAEERGIGNVV
ncbi:hypothetical protein DFJ74DRAFT_649792 [Hyaloraphidium curvatum]|nr:hypothetical protein DFJ74DRAFT_649792 [Hyaloraphidium curvatum]